MSAPRLRIAAGAVCHYLKWTTHVAVPTQAGCIEQKKVLRAKNLPLDHVNEFMEMQGFVPAARRTSRNGVAIHDFRGNASV